MTTRVLSLLAELCDALILWGWQEHRRAESWQHEAERLRAIILRRCPKELEV